MSSFKLRSFLARVMQRYTSLAMLALAGCAQTPISPNASYMALEMPAMERRTLGIALSGGGSKSAPFSLGVLAGLSESGVLNNVDAISTVSGGSYAALFYYARAWEAFLNQTGAPLPAPAPAGPDEIFLDCLPAQRTRGSDGTEHGALISNARPWSKQTGGFCPSGAYDRNYWEPGNPDLAGDPLRYASQLRGNQDVFDRYGNYAANASDSPLAMPRLYGEVIFMNSIILGVPNFISNMLFDWRQDLSYSKKRYNSGIVRAYGASPMEMSGKIDKRPDGSTDVVADLTFHDLRRMRESFVSHPFGKVPLWIINTTAGDGSTGIPFGPNKEYTPERNAFELTPNGFGSGAYGYMSWDEAEHKPLASPDPRVVRAVGASAAFFDSQQRSVGGEYKWFVNLGLRLANLDWGTTIPNYNLSQEAYLQAKQRHALLPWPFYLAHRRGQNQKAVSIRLSDGGQSENLGIYALLRRGVQDIIVVDAAEDKEYRYDDLCNLDRHLRNAESGVRLRIVMEDETLSYTKCDKTAIKRFGGRSQLNKPVLTGYVCRLDDARCDKTSNVARLFLIKPALRSDAKRTSDGYSIDDVVSGLHPRSLSFTECNDSGSKKTAGQHPAGGYPCEVVAFLLANQEKGWDKIFPQHGTATMTANSSPYLFGAYKELGRFYAHFLRFEGSDEHRRIEALPSWADWTQTAQ
jgi:hypothetical protein